MIEDYLQELYKLYTESPFLTYEKLVQYIGEKYNIKISFTKLRDFMLENFPYISEVKKENREKFKGEWNHVFTETQLQELYKLHTEPPFMSYTDLVEDIKKKFNIETNFAKLRDFMLKNFPNISEVKKENREKFKGKWNPIFTKDQLQKLHELRIRPPYFNYKRLVEYSYREFHIDINEAKLRGFMSQAFPDISEEVAVIKNESYFYKDGKLISAEDKEIIIELLAEGYTQREVASLVNVTPPHISRILKKSKLEIEQIRKNRILNKISNIDIKEIEIWWKDSLHISDVQSKLIDKGCDVNFNDTKYILKEVLNVKKKCRLCNREMNLESNSCYCSNKCKKQARQDSIRTQQFNRRVKGNGKTTQSVSRLTKIKEANGICYLCGEILNTKIKDKYHPLYVVLDHVEALIHSNDSSKDNLKPVCRCCNTLKSDKHKDYYSMEQYKNNKKIKLQQYTPKVSNYDQIDIEQFIIDCNNGITIKELCKKYNRSNSVIWRYKENLGLLKKEKIHNKLDEEYATQEVARLTKEGKSILEIADILNISQPTVSNYRKRAISKGILDANPIERGRHKEINTELIDTEQFIIDYNNGMTTKGLCKRYNKSFSVIYKTKKKLGLSNDERFHNKLDEEYITQEVVRLTKDGKSILEIADILKVSHSTVTKYRKRAVLKGILESNNNRSPNKYRKNNNKSNNR